MATNRGGLVVGNIPKSAGSMLDSTMQLDPSAIILLRDFMNIGDALQDYSEPLKRAIRQVAIPSIERNFEDQGRPGWEPLSANTLAMRERLGIGSDRILEVTGALKESATSFDIWTVNRDSAYVANLPTSVWYGVLQQNGLSKVRIPARPFIMLQSEDEDAIEAIFVDWFADVLGDNGFTKGSG